MGITYKTHTLSSTQRSQYVLEATFSANNSVVNGYYRGTDGRGEGGSAGRVDQSVL